MWCIDICITEFFGYAMTLDVLPNKLLTAGIAIVLLSFLQRRKTFALKRKIFVVELDESTSQARMSLKVAFRRGRK